MARLSREEQAEVDKVINSMLARVEAGEESDKVVKEELDKYSRSLSDDEMEAAPEEGVVVTVPLVEVTDIGEYCVDCRDPVDERYPKFASRRPVLREGEGEGGKALKGFLCEDCVPLEGTLMQPLVEALAERRWDEAEVKERMRIVGVEDIYEKVVGPTLDLLEVLLRLER